MMAFKAKSIIKDDGESRNKKPMVQLNGSISIRSNKKAMNTSGSNNQLKQEIQVQA